MIQPLQIKEIIKKTLWDGKLLEFSSGKLAPQSDWAVVIRHGDTSLLVTCVLEKKPNEGNDYFPLTVDFRESFWAWGKIWWSQYQRREWKPSDDTILYARLTDRPLRPMFPKGMINDVVLSITPLSLDKENKPSVASIIGSSLAIMLAGLPFEGPVGAVRIWYSSGSFLINPTNKQLEDSVLDLLVAGSKDTVTMVECESNEVSTEILLQAFELAQQELQKVCKLQEEFLSQCNIATQDVIIKTAGEEVFKEIEAIVPKEQLLWLFPSNKKEFQSKYDSIESLILEHFKAQIEDQENKEITKQVIKNAVFDSIKKFLRKHIAANKIRVDGRQTTQIRPLYCETSVLPRVHWSALFQRGETQALVTTTLGAPWEYQIIDTMEVSEKEKRFFHHYNMPGFSTNEAKAGRWTNRREVWHGRLAEKAIEAVIPASEDYPYVIRTVTDVLSSNWSTSMAAVCGTCLSLLDAGVPLKQMVSWIAMGLFMEENGDYIILSDIQGLEDFIWDMDFKVAGTPNGITALQMDMKIKGLGLNVVKEAIHQANTWRAEILDFMRQTISKPNEKINPYAPKITKMKLSSTQIREVIGPWGAIIQQLLKEIPVKIDFQDDGTTLITSTNQQDSDAAIKRIRELTWTPSVGDTIEWTITRVEAYGVFVNIWKNKVGLCHVKNLGPGFVTDPKVMFKEGDKITVKISGIDDDWKINLKKDI